MGAHRGRSRRRVRPSSLLLVTALSLLALLGWAAWNGVAGARDLQRAAGDVRQARTAAADGSLTSRQLEQIAERTRSARDHLADPVLRALRIFPAVGVPLETASGLARAADVTVRDAALPLVTAAGPSPAEGLTSGPGSVDLARLESLAGPAAQAAAAVQRAASTAAATPDATGVPALDRARQDLLGELAQLQPAVEDLALAAQLGPRLLGAERPQRYLLVSQTPAEARGTGGLIGGYTLLEASRGTLRVLRSGPRSDLESPGEPVVDLGPEYTGHYGRSGPTFGWINSNVSPHFPDAAQIWMALWQRQYGERLDGALLVDPVALSYLLGVTGPVTLPGGETVTGANVVDLTMRDVYARFPRSEDDPQRDAFLQQISVAVASAVTSRQPDGRALVSALSRSVSERRLLLWSGDAQVQAMLATEAISGRIPAGRTVGDVVIDTVGSKLDYYLERSLTYELSCSGMSSLTLQARNTAPATGLPEYVTPEIYRRGQPPGTNVIRTTLYLPRGALVEEVRIDGKVVDHSRGTEQGLVWVEVNLALPPGGASELSATFLESDTDLPLQRLTQPLVSEERFLVDECAG